MITDGAAIVRGRAYELLGTDDLYCIDGSSTEFVVTPLNEEGAVVVETDGSEEGTAFRRHVSNGHKIRIGKFRDHVSGVAGMDGRPDARLERCSGATGTTGVLRRRLCVSELAAFTKGWLGVRLPDCCENFRLERQVQFDNQMQRPGRTSQFVAEASGTQFRRQ